MKTKSHPVGTLVIAMRKVGPVEEGQPGVITGYVEIGSLFWKQQAYLCTFFGNMEAAMKCNEVDDFDHGYSRADLEVPDENDLTVSEQMERVRPARRGTATL